MLICYIMASHPMLSDTSRVRRGDALSSVMDGEVVIVDVETGLYFGLDDIGSEIWERLGDETSVLDLVAALAARYDAPKDVIERDVLTLLRQLQERGLIVTLA